MCVRKAKNAALDGSHLWPNTNRTVIDGKIVVSSGHAVHLMMGPASLFAPTATVDLQDVLRG